MERNARNWAEPGFICRPRWIQQLQTLNDGCEDNKYFRLNSRKPLVASALLKMLVVPGAPLIVGW